MYFIVSGTRLVLGVEDCKDPKLSRNLKFYLLLLYCYFIIILLLFWPDMEEMREIEGTPEILRIISLEGLGVTRMLF